MTKTLIETKFKNTFRLLFLLCLLTFTTPSLLASNSNLHCKSISFNNLSFEAHKGTDLSYFDQQTKELRTFQIQVKRQAERHLGEKIIEASYLGGQHEGFVYLVKTKKGYSSLKFYKEESFAANMKRAFLFLNKFIKENELDMKIPNYHFINKQLAIIDYIPGQTYKSLVNQSLTTKDQLSPGKIFSIRKNLMHFHDKLESEIQNDASTTDYYTDSNVVRINVKGETTKLFLHSDNILVDARDYSLWIIDPY